MDEKSGQQLFEEMYAENDPALRAEVRAALKERGVDRIDPFSLELTLKYGHFDFKPRTPWFEKKHRLRVRLRQTLRTMVDAPMEDWPYYAGDLIGRINDSYRYSSRAFKLSEEALQTQPHPVIFLQSLQNGEDPKAVALAMCNTWMPKELFTNTANLLGSDILSWDDDRSVYWNAWKKGRPENQNLCEEISVQPAGIVAVEPFRIVDYDGMDYDLYGSVVAEVTSFVVSFKPKDGVEPRLLLQSVENAVKEFVEEGAQAFYAPTCRYTNPANAYDRPKKREDEEYWSFSDIGHQLAYGLHDMYPDIVQGYEESYYLEDDKKKFASSLHHTTCAIRDFLEGSEPKSPLPTEILEFLKTYQEDMNKGRYAYLANNGDVVLKHRLILNDVLELYKFCDGFLTPCEAVAHALHAARFDEVCGGTKSAGDLDHLRDGYKSKNMNIENRLGNLEDVPPENVIDKAQHDILVLLGLGESNLHTAFLQVATLAHGTLAGLLPDGTGEYPPMRQITDGSKGTSVVLEEGLLEDRMRSMIERMTNLFGATDNDAPLKERFAQAANAAADLTRHHELIEELCNDYERKVRRYNPSTESFSSITDDMDDDILAHERARAMDCIKEGAIYKPEDQTSVNSLVFRLMGSENAKNPGRDIEDIAHTSPPPTHLDTLGRYMWWRCMAFLQEDRAAASKPEKEYVAQKPSKDLSIRSGLTKWGGEIGLQLPRGFKETGYITRNSHTPFARPGTELPHDLEEFIKEKPNQDGRFLLPDPSIIFSSPKI